jgi:hypothetical protein
VKQRTSASSPPRLRASSGAATATLLYDIARVFACVALAVSSAVAAVARAPNQDYLTGHAQWTSLIIPLAAVR